MHAATASSSFKLQDTAPAVQRLAAASPAFAAALATTQQAMELAVLRLLLEPVHSGAAPQGTFTCTSHDGGAGAGMAAYRGAPVHWLSASALADSVHGVGTCRLLGWTAADRDAPHLQLQYALNGDTMRITVTLWPRQDLITDLNYLHRYFSSAPEGSGLRCYNDIHNAAEAVSGAMSGWRHHQPPQAEAKPLMSFAVSYSFPAADQGNMAAAHGWALETAQLWAAFLEAGGRRPADEQALHRLDARYFSSITSYPGNHVAVKLFGEGATDTLLKMSTGHPKVAS